MQPWTYLVERRAVEQIVEFDDDDRRAALVFLDRLVQAPYQACHAELPSMNGRHVRLKQMGIFVFAYWDDHPVHELRIASVDRL